MAAKMAFSKVTQKAINNFQTVQIPGYPKIMVRSVQQIGNEYQSATWTT